MTAVLVAVLATGTIVEKFHGNEFATTHIYGAWWFFLLMALVGTFVIWVLTGELRRLHRNDGDSPANRPAIMILLSVVFMLAGGALTAWTGQHGSVTLMPQVATSQYITDKGSEKALPFTMTLDKFEVLTYPGTHTPMDFVSCVDVDGKVVNISMNKIHRQSGYRFYQEDYGDDGSSTLSVAYDPWGIAFTYIGYVLLFVGIVWIFASKRSLFRRLLKSSVLSAFFLLMVTFANALSATPRTLPKSTADKMGQLYVMYKGRICPLQTMAKDYVTKLSGNCRYQGLTPEQVFSGWLFYFNDWADEAMIKVKGDDVKQLLGIEGKRASFNDFFAADLDAKSQSATTKNMRAATEKYGLVQMLIGGKFVKIYPVKDGDGGVNWYAQNDDLPLSIADEEYIFIRKQLSYCQELIVKGDIEGLEQIFDKTIQYQYKNAGEVLPCSGRYHAERIYNRLSTGKWLYMLVLMLGIVCFSISVFSDNTKKRLSSVNHIFSLTATAFLTVFLLTIFVLRWIAGGHVPMAGGFDSMNLMALVIGVLGLVMSRRHSVAPSIALLTMGFCLLVAMMSGSNPPVTNLMPVLNSPLLTLHVSVIMISYALFFFIMMGGVAGLAASKRREEMQRINLLLLYPAVSLLTIGIVIGAIWANISWGNYWSWDPKEVWALITLIVYLYPLLINIRFVDREGVLNAVNRYGMRPVVFHIYCIVAFFSVIITYFGVNLILGGMHAYN